MDRNGSPCTRSKVRRRSSALAYAPGSCTSEYRSHSGRQAVARRVREAGDLETASPARSRMLSEGQKGEDAEMTSVGEAPVLAASSLARKCLRRTAKSPSD